MKNLSLSSSDGIRLLGSFLFISSFLFCDILLSIHENLSDACMMLGIMLTYYRYKQYTSIFIFNVAAFRLWDEITLDDGAIDYIDAIETLLIIGLSYLNYKHGHIKSGS